MNIVSKHDITNDPRNPYFGYTKEQMALAFIENYGAIDGSHHKDWVLDQIARVLHGTKVKVTLFCYDDNTQSIRILTEDAPSVAYDEWVKLMCTDHDGNYHPEWYSTGMM